MVRQAMVFLAATAVLLGAARSGAEESLPAGQTPDDRAQLVALKESFAKALNSGDVDSIAGDLASPFALTFNDQITFTDTKAIKARWDEIAGKPDSPVKSMSFKPEPDAPTRLLSETVGIATGSSIDTVVMRDNSVREFKTRWTATLVKIDGKWKVSALHTGANVFDNTIITSLVAAIRKVGIVAALVAGAVGLGLGVAIGRLTKGKTAS